MEKYNCKICGKTHKVCKGFGAPLPDLIASIPEDELEDRVKESNGLYVVDREYFLVKGHIFIYLEGIEDRFFYWQVWATISQTDLYEGLESLMSGKAIEVRGKIQNDLFLYPASLGLEVKASIRMAEELWVEFYVTEDSQLKEDQAKPVNKERVIEIMKRLHHPELFREKVVFDKPFAARLMDELKATEIKYFNEGTAFAINIMSPSTTLFQIISSNLLESHINEQGVSGFGLHLSFDDSVYESKVEIERLRNQNFCKEFEYYELDGIPTYQIALIADKKKIIQLATLIIRDVYEEDIEMIELDSFKV